MDQDIKDKKLKTISYMMKNLSYRHRGFIVEDPSPYPEIQKSIIDDIKTKHGLDFYNLQIDPSMVNDTFSKYELILTDYISNLIDSPVSPIEDDEIFLIKNSRETNPSLLKDTPVDFDPSFFRNLKISVTSTEQWFKTPEFMRVIEIKGKLFILCTRTIWVNNVKKILLFQGNLDVFSSSITKNTIISYFVFPYNTYKDMLSSPIRLFIWILDNYGMIMEISGVKKKLFLELEMDLSDSIITKLINNENKGQGSVYNFNIYPIYRDGKEYQRILFHYGISTDMYINDYLLYNL